MYQDCIGSVLHRIRKGKKLTVKYLIQNIITAPHYYKVEKGEAYLSSNYLFQILDRMNVSYKEFSLLLNSQIEKKRNYFKTIMKVM